ncbi:hypothetical protein [Bacillus haynesii]|uniref:hypothetical protein n=1 Tax=Bacillus haynesii TaxID=1925021 RepID=UPI00227FDB77|nr:hypothetical protein [Bacillus haynesii]MCY7752638.1 hypothetical protein [Bacillus haynesii]MCY8074098.1 hypothetical protein [Bacillus haynesii]
MRKFLALLVALSMITLIVGPQSTVQAHEKCSTCEKSNLLPKPTSSELKDTISLLKKEGINTTNLDNENATIVEDQQDKVVIISENINKNEKQIDFKQYYVNLSNSKYITLENKIEKLNNDNIKVQITNLNNGAKYIVKSDQDGNKIDEKFISPKLDNKFKTQSTSSLCRKIVSAVLGSGTKAACVMACTAVTGGWGAIACSVLCGLVTSGVSWAGAKDMCEQLFG